MRTSVESCPGGLAVVVPAHLAAQVGLSPGGPVDVEVSGGQLLVRTVKPQTLAELLAGITPDNLNIAWDDGPPVGRELLLNGGHCAMTACLQKIV